MPFFEVDSHTGASITAVRFSNGTVVDNEKLVVRSYDHEADEDQESQHIVTAHIDGISYVGNNFGQNVCFPTDACDYYMGVHNKSTNKIKVVPASLIQMNPWLKETEDDSSENAAKSYREQQDKLATEFGSGKSKRAVKKRISDQLEEGMVRGSTQNMLNASSVLAEQEEDTGELAARSDAVPPYDMNAETPDDVYKLKDLVSRQALASMTEVAESLITAQPEQIAEWRREKKYPTFILSKLGELSDEPQSRLLQGQCLGYLSCLIAMYNMKARELKSKFPLPREWPGPVKDHMLQQFTLEVKEPGRPSRRTVPGRMRDLLLSHIMVFGLKMCDFQLNISSLVTDLKVAAKKLKSQAISLGCTVKKHGGQEVYTVTLKVPLTFPSQQRTKAGKNKTF